MSLTQHVTVVDMRKGVCYDTFEDGQCLDPRDMRVTKAQCCCSKGSGWGFRKRGITCEVCPEPYEGKSGTVYLQTNSTSIAAINEDIYYKAS